MKINIIGATGNLGRKVVEFLLAAGHPASDIIASVRTPAKATDMAAQGIAVRRADYDEPASLESAFRVTETLLLIPTFASVEPRIVQHFNALQAARAAGVRRVVFAGFITSPESRFYVAPFLQYAESKLRLSGMEWTIARNNMYMESMVGWTPKFIEAGFVPYPVPTGRIAFVTRDDIARSLAAICRDHAHAGKVYSLTGSEAISSAALGALLTQLSGKDVVGGKATAEDYRRFADADNESPGMINTLLTIYEAAEAGEFGFVSKDIEKITGTPPASATEVLTAKYRS